ncbi:MAG: ABC transporter ATP-binding protein [Clostridia bacterium]|nr:ABC transporter ATP-binding protein [Clostridia bacterium]
MVKGTDAPPILIAQDIVMSFHGKRCLDGIRFSVQRGEIFGLLGQTGAGKTTLIKILTGQLPPDAGSATRDSSASIGIMMDAFGVYERLSVYENLKIYAALYGTVHPKEKITDILEKVGLSEAKKTAAAKLSKGMQSRLRLARVLLRDPDILFLDEPTSGLDPATADCIRQILYTEKKRGKTIFLVTHTMSEAESLCDRIALLCGGKIIECGTPKEICARHNRQKSFALHLSDGTDLCLPLTPDSADRIADLIRGRCVETLHTTEPDLETVFCDLTGEERTPAP